MSSPEENADAVLKGVLNGEKFSGTEVDAVKYLKHTTLNFTEKEYLTLFVRMKCYKNLKNIDTDQVKYEDLLRALEESRKDEKLCSSLYYVINICMLKKLIKEEKEKEEEERRKRMKQEDEEDKGKEEEEEEEIELIRRPSTFSIGDDQSKSEASSQGSSPQQSVQKEMPGLPGEISTQQQEMNQNEATAVQQNEASQQLSKETSMPKFDAKLLGSFKSMSSFPNVYELALGSGGFTADVRPVFAVPGQAEKLDQIESKEKELEEKVKAQEAIINDIVRQFTYISPAVYKSFTSIRDLYPYPTNKYPLKFESNQFKLTGGGGYTTNSFPIIGSRKTTISISLLGSNFEAMYKNVSFFIPCYDSKKRPLKMSTCEEIIGTETTLIVADPATGTLICSDLSRWVPSNDVCIAFNESEVIDPDKQILIEHCSISQPMKHGYGKWEVRINQRIPNGLSPGLHVSLHAQGDVIVGFSSVIPTFEWQEVSITKEGFGKSLKNNAVWPQGATYWKLMVSVADQDNPNANLGQLLLKDFCISYN